MVITSLSERWGAGPGRSKACWITGDPFIASSTMVKRVVRTVAFSSIRSALLVCLCVYKLKRTTVLFLCHQLAQSVYIFANIAVFLLSMLPPRVRTERAYIQTRRDESAAQCHPVHQLVILSAAKDLSRWAARSFAALRMPSGTLLLVTQSLL